MAGRINIEKQSSFLTQPVIIIALYLMAVICAYFRLYSLIFWLISAIVMTIAFFWGKSALGKLEVNSDGSIHYCYPGKKVCIEFKIKNNKLVPLLWLRFIQKQPDNKCIISVEKSGFEKRLSSLLWNSQIQFVNTYFANGRGIFKIEKAVISTGDGFGLTESNVEIDIIKKALIVVFPKKIPVYVERFLKVPLSGATGNAGIFEDQTLLMSTRIYDNTDSWKKIDWRLAAKSDELQAKKFETYRHQGVHFIIDVKSYIDIEDEFEFTESDEKSEEYLNYLSCKKDMYEKVEKVFSIVGSLISELIEKGVVCGISLPQTENIHPKTIIGHTDIMAEELLFELASFDEKTAGSTFDFVSLNNVEEIKTKVYYFCLSNKQISSNKILERIPSNILYIVADEISCNDEIKQIRLDELYDNSIIN